MPLFAFVKTKQNTIMLLSMIVSYFLSQYKPSSKLILFSGHQLTLYPSGFNTKRFKVYFDTNDTQKSLKPISPLLKGVQEPHEELMAGEGVWLVAGDAVERSNSIRITEPNRIAVLFHSDSFLFAVFRHMEMVHREKQYDMVKVTK